MDALLLAGSCAILAITLFNTTYMDANTTDATGAKTPGAREYAWCLRLIVLLTVKHTFTIAILSAQWIAPIAHSGTNFVCRAAFSSAVRTRGAFVVH